VTHKNRKKSRIFMFLSTGCSLLRAEGFFCSLGVLYGGLGKSKLQFLIKKIEIKFPATVGAESLCRAKSLCRNTCISYFRHLELR